MIKNTLDVEGRGRSGIFEVQTTLAQAGQQQKPLPNEQPKIHRVFTIRFMLNRMLVSRLPNPGTTPCTSKGQGTVRVSFRHRGDQLLIATQLPYGRIWSSICARGPDWIMENSPEQAHPNRDLATAAIDRRRMTRLGLAI